MLNYWVNWFSNRINRLLFLCLFDKETDASVTKKWVVCGMKCESIKVRLKC